MARDDAEERESAGEVTLLVCMTCGREYQYEVDEAPPSELTCAKCGSQVFRQFDDAAAAGEASAEFRDQTERDLATNDPEGEATRGDLHDLNP